MKIKQLISWNWSSTNVEMQISYAKREEGEAALEEARAAMIRLNRRLRRSGGSGASYRIQMKSSDTSMSS